MCWDVSRGTALSISTQLGAKAFNVDLCRKRESSRRYVWWNPGKGEAGSFFPTSLLLYLYATQQASRAYFMTSISQHRRLHLQSSHSLVGITTSTCSLPHTPRFHLLDHHDFASHPTGTSPPSTQIISPWASRHQTHHDCATVQPRRLIITASIFGSSCTFTSASQPSKSGNRKFSLLLAP